MQKDSRMKPKRDEVRAWVRVTDGEEEEMQRTVVKAKKEGGAGWVMVWGIRRAFDPLIQYK